MSTSVTKQPIAVLLLTLLVAACDDEGGMTVPVGHQLEIVSGNSQIGPAGGTLPEPLAVRVTNRFGDPIDGIKVIWIAGDADAGGSVSHTTSRSDRDGIATVERTMGSGAGEQITTARLESAASIRFTSIAQIQGATNIELAPDGSWDHQTDTVFATLHPLRVRVIDQDGTPVAGIVVSWDLEAGSSGALSAEVSATDADGIAEATLTLGSGAGAVGVQASVEGLVGSPVSFQATANPGNPAALLAYAGDDQVGMVTRQLAPYTVEVTDAYGNAIGGVRIDWEVTAGDGLVDPNTSTTAACHSWQCDYYYYYYYYDWDRTPVASTTYYLGSGEGSQTVTASAPDLPDLPSVTFTSRAVTAIIELDTIAFTPAGITLQAGQTVAWVWVSGRHNVTFEDDPTEPVSSPTKSEGRHFRTFDQAGTFRYRCSNHSTSFDQGMVGTVTVQ